SRLVTVAFALSFRVTLAFAGEDVDSRRAQVDAVFADYQRTDSPGCALGVFNRGGIEYARGYGMANLELGAAITPSTVFDIGSTSKQFTVFAVLLLEQDGKLRIEDEVRKYVPELPDYGAGITIQNLMQHTSGLRDYLGLFWLAGIGSKDVTSGKDALDVIVRQKALNFEPGEEYLYSNSGFFLLSQIVERVSGKTLPEFAKERIFEPLGMRHTRYLDDPQDIVPNRSTGYSHTPEGELEIDMSDFEQTGDGAVYTTIEDLFLWDQNFYHPRVGTSEMLKRMQTPGTLPSGKPITYGLGLSMTKHRGLDSVSHGGAWAGYRAELVRFPGQKLSVACLCNLGEADPSDLARRVAGVYLGAEMTPEEESRSPEGEAATVTLTTSELESRAGVFRGKETGEYLFLSASDGKLLLESGGASVLFLPLSPTRFAAESRPSVQLFFEGGGLSFRRGSDTDEFERIAPFTPDPARLSDYAGVYQSDEIAGYFEIEVDAGALVLNHRTLPRDPLRPTRSESFYIDGLSLNFTRDSRGQVDGFILDMGRVKGIRYSRV
ncbi:MAG: serine hydrolase domain-containing protein, partial [Vicinamibacteria bacterium]